MMWYFGDGSGVVERIVDISSGSVEETHEYESLGIFSINCNISNAVSSVDYEEQVYDVKTMLFYHLINVS